jgi:hypothetical protein
MLAWAVLGCQGSGDAQAVAVAGLALPAGARVVTPAKVTGRTGRVGTEACVASRAGAAVAEDLRVALSKEWQAVRIIPSTVAGRWVVVGRTALESVSGVVDEARPGPCAAGEVYLNLGVTDIPSESATKDVGARGPRAAASGRMPIVPQP